MTDSRQITIARPGITLPRVEITVDVFQDDSWTGYDTRDHVFAHTLTISEHDRAMALFEVFTEHGVYRPGLQ